MNLLLSSRKVMLCLFMFVELSITLKTKIDFITDLLLLFSTNTFFMNCRSGTRLCLVIALHVCSSAPRGVCCTCLTIPFHLASAQRLYPMLMQFFVLWKTLHLPESEYIWNNNHVAGEPDLTFLKLYLNPKTTEKLYLADNKD